MKMIDCHLKKEEEDKCMNTTTQLLSMKNRCVLITGAAAGIGKAMALRFADAGANLVLLDIDKVGLEQAVEDLRGFSSEVVTHVVDLTKKTQIDRFWNIFSAGTPDTLINNAGSYPMVDYLEVDQRFLEKNHAAKFGICRLDVPGFHCKA